MQLSDLHLSTLMFGRHKIKHQDLYAPRQSRCRREGERACLIEEGHPAGADDYLQSAL
jgi:hypothetical protein